MQFETVPIDSISQDPANLRAHSRENLDRIKASLRRFSQQRVLVVDNNGIIRAGNGTYQAAKELGWTEVTIHRTVLGGSEATAYSIADNAATRGSDWTSAADLANVLASLRDDGVPVEAAGFSDAELDAMLAGVGEADEESAAEPADHAAVEQSPARWMVIVECATEAAQEGLVERLRIEGLDAKAIVS